MEYREDVCPHCHSFLDESMGNQLPPIERHQVWELPEIRPLITEHRLLVRLVSFVSGLGETKLAGRSRQKCLWSQAASLGGYFDRSLSSKSSAGERTVAGIVWGQHQPGKRPSPVRRNLRGLGGGALLEVQGAVLQADMAQVDETGWKEKGKRHWLWVAVTNVATLFLISCSRWEKSPAGAHRRTFPGYRAQ